MNKVGVLALLLLLALVTSLSWFWLRLSSPLRRRLPDSPGRQPKTLDGFLRLFQSSGLLVHMLSPLWIQAFLVEQRASFTLDTDCDPNHSCAAYTFWQQNLPLSVVSFEQERFQFGLCYDAAALWPEVMCMSVFDANTKNRNCCTCADADDCVDARLCTAKACTRKFDTPYCKRVCGNDQTCRALNAGCGPNIWALKNSGTCLPDVVLDGACGACKSPQWCGAEGVDSGPSWLKRFLAHGGHGNQCRFKREQAQLWFETMLDFYAEVQLHGAPPDFVSLENEVNFYLNSDEPDYAATHEVFMGGLMAILYFPNNVAPGAPPAVPLLDQLRQLQTHLRSLVGDVPILQLNVEAPLSLTHWRKDAPAELLGGFYDLKVV